VGAVENLSAVETRYREHQQQIDHLDAEHRQTDKPVKRHPVRQVVAKALVALATMLAPTAQRESRVV
jgi:hypothetical protein